MKLFEKNWTTSRFVDFELKKYTLLAYLQKVEKKFTESKVYPYLPMLIEENRQLIQFINEVDFIRQQFQSMAQRRGESPALEQAEIEILMRLGEFALPRLQSTIESGNEIEQFVLNALEFRPVGVLPVTRSEGYLIFKINAFSRVYRYQLRRVAPFCDTETYTHQLKTWFVQQESYSKFKNAEDVKHELIKAHKDLPNPATYCVETDFKLPYTETLVPIGRKLLYKILAD